MVRLTLYDQKKLAAFVRDAYAMRDFSAFVAFVLAALPRLINSEVTSYNEMRPQAHESRNWVNPGSLMVSKRDEAWANVMHEHPVVNHYQRNGADKVLRISDFLSPRELRNMALYSEHYRPLGGMLDCLPILWGGDTVNAIGVHRRALFNEREQAMMDFLRPHLIQAHANATTVSRLMGTQVWLERALEASRRAVVILDRDRTIAFATAPARSWLRYYFDCAGGAERLPEMLDLWTRQHDAAVRTALALPRPRDPLVVLRGNRRLVIWLLPADAELMLIFEEQELGVSASSLASLGLTLRESEVLAELASGKSKEKIAARMGVNPRTIETHLLHINQRLGVSSATAAAAKAFEASRIGERTPDRDEQVEIRRYVRRKLMRNSA